MCEVLQFRAMKRPDPKEKQMQCDHCDSDTDYEKLYLTHDGYFLCSKCVVKNGDNDGKKTNSK